MATDSPRIYLDSSVFGGAFDAEFEDASVELFKQIRAGQFRLVISEVVAKELEYAPERVMALFTDLLAEAEAALIDPAAEKLQAAYLHAGVLSIKYEADALHVALATVSHCRAIVSWNFRHIVHMDKIEKYNVVNRSLGYNDIRIQAPPEVLKYEE